MTWDNKTADEAALRRIEDNLGNLVREIVDSPEDVRIERHQQDGKTVLTIHSNRNDVPHIIGKEGSMIQSIRRVFLSISKKNQVGELILKVCE